MKKTQLELDKAELLRLGKAGAPRPTGRLGKVLDALTTPTTMPPANVSDQRRLEKLSRQIEVERSANLIAGGNFDDRGEYIQLVIEARRRVPHVEPPTETGRREWDAEEAAIARVVALASELGYTVEMIGYGFGREENISCYSLTRECGR